MDQLGGRGLEHQPGRHQPAAGKAHQRLVPPPPQGDHGTRQQGHRREEQQQGGQQVGAGRGGMALMPAAELGGQVAADGRAPELAVRGHGDGHGPGPDDQQDDAQSPDPAQLPRPLQVPVQRPQGQERQGRDHRTDRPLVQQRHPLADPEQGLQAAVEGLSPPGGKIEPGQCRHGQGHRRAQHRVGLGDEGLRRQQDGGSEHGPRQGAAAGPQDSGRPPGAGGGGDHAAQQGRQAIGLDGPGLHLRGQGHRRHLQPVDAHRLLVPGGVLVADLHEIAGFQHLGAGLGEAGFVPVEGRQGQEPRQGADQHHQRRQQRAAPAAGDPVGEGLCHGGRVLGRWAGGGSIRRAHPPLLARPGPVAMGHGSSPACSPAVFAKAAKSV